VAKLTRSQVSFWRLHRAASSCKSSFPRGRDGPALFCSPSPWSCHSRRRDGVVLEQQHEAGSTDALRRKRCVPSGAQRQGNFDRWMDRRWQPAPDPDKQWYAPIMSPTRTAHRSSGGSGQARARGAVQQQEQERRSQRLPESPVPPRPPTPPARAH
jgi:hypothetical protein